MRDRADLGGVRCQANHSISVPPLQLYENGNFDHMITLLTLYMLNFKAYLSKLDIAPSSLGYGKKISCNWLACNGIEVSQKNEGPTDSQ